MQKIKHLSNWKSIIGVLGLAIVLTALVTVNKATSAANGILWESDKYIVYIPSTKAPKKEDLNVNFGVYDLENQFDNNPHFAIDHVFVNWNTVTKEQLTNIFENSSKKGRWNLITIEPYPNLDNSENENPDVLAETIEGQYDTEIQKLCTTFNESANPVFIRWGHEMENVTDRYPWAVEDSNSYINAYNHFVKTCKELYTNGIYVWSPVGNDNLHKYWPGTENVDYIGLSVYEFPEWDYKNIGRKQTFEDIFEPKYRLVEIYEKPIIIAEMGVTGDERYKVKWMYNAFGKFNKYELLKSVVYFNSIDNEGAWGESYDIPDWTVPDEVFAF